MGKYVCAWTAGLLLCNALSAQTNASLIATDTASLLFVNTPMYERDFALSPDGKTCYYTLQMPGGGIQTILERKRNKAGNWSEPEVASFAGKYSDLEPAFSPDGKKLYFVSNRPFSGEKPKDFDIWVIEKTADGSWGVARNLGTPVNGPGNEFYPAITQSGNLYFTAELEKGIGKEDIVVCYWKEGKYEAPVALDSAINSATYEFNAYVSPGEDWIVFTSYGRKDDKGGGDLYISKKTITGKWRAAVNMASINSNKIDYCPFISFDKQLFFFTSERSEFYAYEKKPATYRQLAQRFTNSKNGAGNIYVIRFESLLRSITGFQRE